MDKEPITVNGLKDLKLELENLKNVKRPKVVEAIAEARSHGDLKENAEYHAAKEQQGLIEGRIVAINDIIARANVIDVTKIENAGKVIFGSTVMVKDLETHEQIAFRYCDENGEITDSANANGSSSNIAGIFNKRKTILGMMPHPENATQNWQTNKSGLPLFESILEALS